MQRTNHLRPFPWILVGVLGTLYVTKPSGTPRAQVTDSTPTIVESLRQIGFLQAAEANLSEAFEFATHKSPGGIAANVPGADALVRAATENTVWVQANGKVKAGFDLSKATVRSTGDSIQITLPKVVIDSPNVDIKLVMSKKGLLWKDDEILLKATETAKERFSMSALRTRLRADALESAKSHLRDFLSKTTDKRVEIRQM